MRTAEMKVTALVPYFGASRMIGEHVGKALDGCTHVTVPFAGGCCELAHITARTLVVSDVHRAVMNLCAVAADRELGVQLYRSLRRDGHHAGIFEEAQRHCRICECLSPEELPLPDLPWAESYFRASWMARNGHAGKKDEFDVGFSVRYDAGGGDSAVRYRNAVKSIIAWRRVLSRATFVCMDAFELLAKVKDAPGCALYCDPPWPGDGKDYKHSFDEQQQYELAHALAKFRQTRVVVRYGDCDLIRRLYPESHWKWQEIEGRTSGNNAKAEVLIVNKSSLGESEGRLF